MCAKKYALNILFQYYYQNRKDILWKIISR